MACAFQINENPDWNWMKGESTKATIGGKNLVRDYFTCGTYFFDGRYKMVKFPAGMSLYHGSKALADANVAFPAGVAFYDQNDRSFTRFGKKMAQIVASSDESVEKILADFMTLSPGWFADLRTAKLYSRVTGCNKNVRSAERTDTDCVMAYKLKRDATFMLIDDPYNIWKMLNDDSLSLKFRNAVRQMFSLDVRAATKDIVAIPQSYNTFNMPNTKRYSARSYELPFAKDFCELAKTLGIAGYAADFASNRTTGKSYFHLEFMFCDAFEYLERDLSNANDINRLRMDDDVFEYFFPETRTFFRQLKLYKTTDYGYHAGNLFEHTIWCELIAETLTKDDKLYLPRNSTRQFISAVALVHDIGKMTPASTNRRSTDFIYFELPTHPAVGAEFVTGRRKLAVVDPNDVTVYVGDLDVDALIKELQFEETTVERDALIPLIVEYHMEFVKFVNNLADKSMSLDVAADAYVKLVSDTRGLVNVRAPLPFLYYYALVIVSVADVLATQPFRSATAGVEQYAAKSEFYDFVYNVPKNYKGSDIGTRNAQEIKELKERVLADCWTLTTDHDGFKRTT